MKILNSNSKNFDKTLDAFAFAKKEKSSESNSVSVTSIIKDVKKKWRQSFIKI